MLARKSLGPSLSTSSQVTSTLTIASGESEMDTLVLALGTSSAGLSWSHLHVMLRDFIAEKRGWVKRAPNSLWGQTCTKLPLRSDEFTDRRRLFLRLVSMALKRK